MFKDKKTMRVQEQDQECKEGTNQGWVLAIILIAIILWTTLSSNCMQQVVQLTTFLSINLAIQVGKNNIVHL